MDDENQSHDDPEAPIHLSAEKARGGEIILRTRAMRIVFLVGLVGLVLFVFVFLYAR